MYHGRAQTHVGHCDTGDGTAAGTSARNDLLPPRARTQAATRQGRKRAPVLMEKIVASRAQVKKLKVASYQHCSVVMMVH